MTQQELERAIQEVWTLFKETDKRLAEWVLKLRRDPSAEKSIEKHKDI